MDVIFWNESPENWHDYPIMNRYVGAYKIAHWLRKHGHTAQVIDFIRHADEELLYRLTTKFITPETKILGISTTFISSGKSYIWKDGTHNKVQEYIISVLRRIKQEFNHIKIVLGGYMSDKIYYFGLADATIMNYTEATEDIFLEYLEHLKTGSEPPLSKLITQYIGTEEQKKLMRHRIHYNSARNKKYNIEVDDFRFVEQDAILDGEVLPMDVSRGCIFACRFCQYPHLGKKKLDYIRGMEYIQEEMEYNYRMFKTTNYNILDDTFNDTQTKLRSFNDMTDKLPFDINYVAYIRADLVHRFPDMAYMLKESGIYGAFNGIESLHPAASNSVGKAWSGKHAREFIPQLYHNIWKGEVAQSLGFIGGLPGENAQSLRDTAKWFLENKLYHMFMGNLGLFGTGFTESEKSLYSEFDRNYEKYGYSFETDSNNKKYWKNDIWDERQSAIECRDIMNEVRKFNKLDAWATLGTLHLGADKKQLLKTTIPQLDYNGLRNSFNIKINEYFAKLISL